MSLRSRQTIRMKASQISIYVLVLVINARKAPFHTYLRPKIYLRYNCVGYRNSHYNRSKE